MTHAWLSGQWVAAWDSVSWAALTVTPWFLVFEAIKRWGRAAGDPPANLLTFAAGVLTLAWAASAWLSVV